VQWLQTKRGQIQTRYKEDIIYNECGETLAQVAERGGRCPIPGNIPGQVGQGSEQPDPLEGVPAHCRGLEYKTFNGPFQLKSFYDSMNFLGILLRQQIVLMKNVSSSNTDYFSFCYFTWY